MKASGENYDILKKALVFLGMSDQAVPVTTTFEDLHMDSYDIVDFLMKVEELSGIILEDSNVVQMHCLQDVLEELDKCSKEELSNA